VYDEGSSAIYYEIVHKVQKGKNKNKKSITR